MNGNCVWRQRGFGGNAPNKLMASAEGEGSERVSDPCRRHGHKLVHYLFLTDCKRKEGWCQHWSALVSSSSEVRARLVSCCDSSHTRMEILSHTTKKSKQSHTRMETLSHTAKKSKQSHTRMETLFHTIKKSNQSHTRMEILSHIPK